MIGKILFRLFALFGMTLTCVACYGTEYDEFHPEYGASGRVVDPEGNPIEGIQVTMADKCCYSNPNGRFYVGAEYPVLIIRDVDGEKNGGEFSEKIIELQHGGNHDVGDVELQRIK